MAVAVRTRLQYLGHRCCIPCIIGCIAKFTIHIIIIIDKMLKRIKDRFSQDTLDVDTLNEYGYVPTHEEVASKIGWTKLSEHKRKYDFQGEFHCTACPKKLLNTEQELKEHLESKVCTNNC